MQTYDVIVLGAGPAGLAAGIYTARGNLSTLIVGEEFGGQVASIPIVENYPGFPEGISGWDLVGNMKQQAEKYGAKFLQGKVTNIDTSSPLFAISTDHDLFQARSVVVAFGAAPKQLNVPGEKELVGKGVAFCATCDAPLFKNKKVLVVGGGDCAMQFVDSLQNFASEVVLVHWLDSFQASFAMQQKLKGMEKIKVFLQTEVTEILGDTKVEAVALKRGSNIFRISVDGVFVAIGRNPRSSVLRGKVGLDEAGYIKLPMKSSMTTTVPGVFAAGDIVDKHCCQIASSVGFGCQAALETIAYLATH